MHDRAESINIANQTIAAWGDYVSERLSSGWGTYLLSFMFEPLPGSREQKMAQMARLLEAAYGVFVTRVVRKPRTAGRLGTAPIWLCSPDLPVFKREKRDKARLRDLEINDVLHYHAVLLMPPRSRLRDVNGHLISFGAPMQNAPTSTGSMSNQSPMKNAASSATSKKGAHAATSMLETASPCPALSVSCRPSGYGCHRKLVSQESGCGRRC